MAISKASCLNPSRDPGYPSKFSQKMHLIFPYERR